MNVSVNPGKYVVAVSGGVDSVALLDLLRQQPELELVVAHFDHGIRDDSAEDAHLVASLAEKYRLPFVTKRVELGPDASEAQARLLRYEFLQQARQDSDSQAIITAHHQDDLLETAVMNIMRGTGRLGLTSLKSTPEIIRPLLDIPKTEIIAYAIKQKLSWREDSSNHDQRYTRNYIRHSLLVRFDDDARQQLLALIQHMQVINNDIDDLLEERLAVHSREQGLSRRWFNSLPHMVAKEVMAAWLRQHKLANFDRKTIERLTVEAKVRPAGKQLNVMENSSIMVSQHYLALSPAER